MSYHMDCGIVTLTLTWAESESEKESLISHDHHSHLYWWQAKQNTRNTNGDGPIGRGVRGKRRGSGTASGARRSCVLVTPGTGPEPPP